VFRPVHQRTLCDEQKDAPRNSSKLTPSPVRDQNDLFVDDRGEFVGSHAVPCGGPRMRTVPVGGMVDGVEREIEERWSPVITSLARQLPLVPGSVLLINGSHLP
jgi:hypothetical protein